MQSRDWATAGWEYREPLDSPAQDRGDVGKKKGRWGPAAVGDLDTA